MNLTRIGALLLLTGWQITMFAQNTETIRLWDDKPPLAVENPKPEAYQPIQQGQNPDITRLGNVSIPDMTVYHAPKEKRNGTCVMICPGGGYSILAMKHEGTQVAEWLNSIGVTAVVLKYRVPSPQGMPPHLLPLLDAQRALSLIRAHAKKWDLDENRIGVLGFSAGGNLATWALCEGDRRPEGYPVKETVSCRPNFGILIYPAYLANMDKPRPMPVIQLEQKPGPVFFVHASDDKLGSENSIEFYMALKKVGVPAEMHIYQQGGHGFGMLRQGLPANDWPKRCEEWMKAIKLNP